ncbi:hypothetical protein [Chitinophaga ginsengisoli]|uniref:Uncharacterized protein n=1 Tax=Chitinophaga ginsengisoli TaxID=363837 RepID=A0A2P8GH95_9BACT|nr:hypothetical protein [Chitinophaga ginsengisoli]PSL33315.1 hypothetical protein CLV42_103298 [Chitinophaga ginsengisoli]
MINNMTDENDSFRWKISKNGIRSVAFVNIEVFPNPQGRNEIEEHYSGKGFVSQGYMEEIPAIGYDSWKLAARNGLQYAFSLITTHWTVRIHKIEGRSVTDTNPTVVGYTVLLAFLDKIGFRIDREQTDMFEAFVLNSWTKPYKELIPDFFNLSYMEYQ